MSNNIVKGLVVSVISTLLVTSVLISGVSFMALSKPIIAKSNVSSIKPIVFDGEFNEENITRLINDIKVANETQDKIIVDFTSPGGNVTDYLRLIKFLNTITKEKVVIVDDYAASAGAMTVLHFDKIIMKKNSFLLFHLPYIQGVATDKFRDSGISIRGFALLMKIPDFDKAMGLQMDTLIDGNDVVVDAQSLSVRIPSKIITIE